MPSLRKTAKDGAVSSLAARQALLQISTQDRTARDEQTTQEDTAHTEAHTDPKTTTAKNAQAAAAAPLTHRRSGAPHYDDGYVRAQP